MINGLLASCTGDVPAWATETTASRSAAITASVLEAGAISDRAAWADIIAVARMRRDNKREIVRSQPNQHRCWKRALAGTVYLFSTGYTNKYTIE